MNDKPLISIIVPLYNCDKYISRCLDSILEQTYKNIEIIAVDDGSTDNSADICRNYAESDNRIKYFFQNNSGVSAARNNGLNHAIGEWIGFCDSDDYIEPDMYEYLINLAQNYNADITQCGTFMTFSDKEKVTFLAPNDTAIECIFDTDKTVLKNYNSCVWSKIFKRKCIEELSFDSKYIIGEDLLFSVKAAMCADKIILGDKAKYHYIQRDGSACYAKPTSKSIISVRRVLNEISDLFPDKTAAKEFYFHEQLRNDFDICSKFIRYSTEDSDGLVEQVRNELKDNIKNIVYSEDFSLKEKVKAFLISNLWSFYALLIRNKKRNKLL